MRSEKALKSFFYKQTKYEFREGKQEYYRVDRPENALFVYTLTRDLGATINELPNTDKDWLNSRDLDRHDPDLVAVVEELGKVASGQCAELKIVEIPDGTDYEISEYDGSEHIAETHTTWR